jgi:hypothetical protein
MVQHFQKCIQKISQRGQKKQRCYGYATPLKEIGASSWPVLTLPWQLHPGTFGRHKELPLWVLEGLHLPVKFIERDLPPEQLLEKLLAEAPELLPRVVIKTSYRMIIFLNR